MNEKIKLAQHVIKLIKECELVNDVILRGSLATGGNDRYTDIDLNVFVKGNDVLAVSNELLDKTKQKYNMLIEDWGLSFIPIDFVHTIYLEIEDLFSFIDIEYHFEEGVEVVNIDKLENDKLSHDIKLFVLNIKRVSRNYSDNLTLERMFERLLKDKKVESNVEKLVLLLKYFKDSNPNNNQKKILIKCEKEIQRLKKEIFESDKF